MRGEEGTSVVDEGLFIAVLANMQGLKLEEARVGFIPKGS